MAEEFRDFVDGTEQLFNYFDGTEEDEGDINELALVVEPVQLRQRPRNPDFNNWSDREFFHRFRLSKEFVVRFKSDPTKYNGGQ